MNDILHLRVAGIQMSVTNNIDRNVDAVCAAIARAADNRADILLTPEGALSGYRHDFDADEVAAALAYVTAFAASHNVGLALGVCNREPDGLVYNELRFYTPSGDYLGFHSKILRCGSLEFPPVGEINHFATTPLQLFPWTSGCAVGGLLCNDLWANPECTPVPDPHLSQQLSTMGARIIFHAVNGGRDGSEWSRVAWRYHESNLRMRARAGGVWIVTVDNCSPIDLDCSAPSGVVAPWGEWAVRTDPRGVRFFVHTIELPVTD